MQLYELSVNFTDCSSSLSSCSVCRLTRLKGREVPIPKIELILTPILRLNMTHLLFIQLFPSSVDHGHARNIIWDFGFPNYIQDIVL